MMSKLLLLSALALAMRGAAANGLDGLQSLGPKPDIAALAAQFGGKLDELCRLAGICVNGTSPPPPPKPACDVKINSACVSPCVPTESPYTGSDCPDSAFCTIVADPPTDPKLGAITNVLSPLGQGDMLLAPTFCNSSAQCAAGQFCANSGQVNVCLMSFYPSGPNCLLGGSAITRNALA